MKLWYTMFIMTFLMAYGTLSIVLLGNWAYERVKALKGEVNHGREHEVHHIDRR